MTKLRIKKNSRIVNKSAVIYNGVLIILVWDNVRDLHKMIADKTFVHHI